MLAVSCPLFKHRLRPAECPGAGRVRFAASQREEETHHPDGALAGGVLVHAGRGWSPAALLQNCIRHFTAPVQVWHPFNCLFL